MATKTDAVSGVESTMLTEAYECDYERNCTPLYKAIETSEDEDEYESILDFLETGKWTGPFEGLDGPSAIEQVKTWVTRFDTSEPNKVKWSQLPLHLAIVCGAPAQIVASLVKIYPEALRCTDDQHMLPLHLALRHESDDEVIAFLLIQFPEAVNARGKNGRSAVDCALRAKDKLRGIILEIFTEKTASKITSQMNKEKKDMKNELDNRTSELLLTSEALESKTKELETLSTKERNVNDELIKTKDEIENDYKEQIDKLKGEKLIMEVIAQKKIDQLLALIKEKDLSEKQARIEELSVKRDLETLQGRVALSKSTTDWDYVKKESENLKEYRLKKTRSETQSTINSLKSELEKSIEISKLSDDKIKNDLKGELKQLKSIVDKIQKTETSATSSSELTSLRNEVEILRNELKERGAAKQTKIELSIMKKAMEIELRNSEGKTNEELASLKKYIAAANSSDLEKKTSKELMIMKEEFEKLKGELKEKELATRTKEDVDQLKDTLERTMSTADNKTKSELANMKKLVESLQSSLKNNKSTDDMVAVKQEVEGIKEELKKKETSSKIKLEAALLKKMVEAELLQAEGKTQSELIQMKKAIKDLSDKALENKDVEELAKVRSELLFVKEELKEVGKISKTQQELETLKRDLAEEMTSSKGKTEDELLSMKNALDAMNLEHTHSKELKKALEEEIKNASGKTDAELKQLKKAIDSIDLNKLETKNQNEWETIRKEIDVLAAFLKKRQKDGVGETKNELRAVKEAVAKIDIDKLESRHRSEFDYLKSEMDTIKAEMKQKMIDEENLKKELEAVKSQKKKRNGLVAFFMGKGTQKNDNRVQQSTRNLPSKPVTDVSIIAPPSVPNRQFNESNAIEGKVNVKDDGSDDNSYSSAMKDAEKSRNEKATNGMILMASKSREVGFGDDASAHSKRTNNTQGSVGSNNRGMETLKIVSLHQSKSEVGRDQDSISSSVQGAKSDMGRAPRVSRISKPIPIMRITPDAFDNESRDHPDSASSIRDRKQLVSSMKGSKSLMMRRTKSMDPRQMNTNNNEDAYIVVRTMSKPVVNENGEVELHRVDEEDDEDMMIQPRVSFVSQF